jgi:hypothetical protein
VGCIFHLRLTPDETLQFPSAFHWLHDGGLSACKTVKSLDGLGINTVQIMHI